MHRVISLFVPASLALLSACSGTNPGASAGPDASSSSACGTDLSTLMIPDAGIDDLVHDSGATVPVCVACARSNCEAQLAACDSDCTCNAAVVGLVHCLAAGMSQLGECEAVYFSMTTLQDEPSGQVFACLNTNCETACY